MILMLIMPSLSVNIISVSSCTKTHGELLTVEKVIQKSGAIAHSQNTKPLNPAQVNGLVMILNGSPLLIWIGTTKTVMVKSMPKIISEIFLDYMILVILMVITPSTSVNITSVSSTTKTLGELLHAQKDTHKSGATVHLKLLIPAQVLGIVMISSVSPLNT